MAILEARLIPLIEALTEAGADWLAFEILDGIRAGKMPEVDTQRLDTKRIAVRSAKHQEKVSKLRAVPTPSATPILGDEQLRWAAEYMQRRLSETTLMIEAIIEQFGTILAKGADPRKPQSVDELPAVELVVQIDESSAVVARKDVVLCKTELTRLGRVTDAWLTSVTIDRVTE